VTERVYNAWVAGAIPVYIGAPDALDFAPHPKAFIFVRARRTVRRVCAGRISQ
jgi:hypothetical protein